MFRTIRYRSEQIVTFLIIMRFIIRGLTRVLSLSLSLFNTSQTHHIFLIGRSVSLARTRNKTLSLSIPISSGFGGHDNNKLVREGVDVPPPLADCADFVRVRFTRLTRVLSSFKKKLSLLHTWKSAITLDFNYNRCCLKPSPVRDKLS